MEGYGILDNKIKKIPQRIWVGLASGIIAGFLTHLYMLTHKLPNWDDINNFNVFGQGSNIGRWFLQYIHRLGGSWSLPAVHGAIAILFLAVAACLISEILELRRTVSVVAVSITMLTFPSVAGTMAFMFTVHAYAMAIMMMCLGVYLIRKYKYGFIPGMALIIIGMGTYQPYVSFAIGLMLISMLSDLLRKKKKGKEALLAGIKYAAILLVGVGIYMLLCRLFFPGIANETYGGVGQMGQIKITEMPRLIGRCYKRFLEYFILKPFGYVSPTMHRANILVCVGIGALFIYNLISAKLAKDRLAIFLYLAVSALIPFALAFIYFMAPDAPFSILMIYSYVLLYPAALMLLEIAADGWQSVRNNKSVVKIMQKIAVIAVICSVLLEAYTGYIIINEAYFRMSIAYERATAFFNRILVNVENEEDYNYGDKVAILGEFYYVDNPSPIEVNSMDDYKFREMSGIALENGMITSGVRDNFIRMYLGFELPGIDNAVKEQIMASEEYLQMPCYPTEGCIMKFDDIWVVKLCD